MLIVVLCGGRIMCGFYLFFAIVGILQSGEKKKHVFFKSILGSIAFGVRCMCKSPNPQANGEQERKVWVGKDGLQVREVQEKWLSAGSCGICSLEKKFKNIQFCFWNGNRHLIQETKQPFWVSCLEKAGVWWIRGVLCPLDHPGTPGPGQAPNPGATRSSPTSRNTSEMQWRVSMTGVFMILLNQALVGLFSSGEDLSSFPFLSLSFSSFLSLSLCKEELHWRWWVLYSLPCSVPCPFLFTGAAQLFPSMSQLWEMHLPESPSQLTGSSHSTASLTAWPGRSPYVCCQRSLWILILELEVTYTSQWCIINNQMKAP